MKTLHAIILALGLTAAFGILGYFHYSARSSRETISVVGLATRTFDSDIIKWSISLNRTVPLSDLTGGYKAMQRDAEIIRQLLREKGLPDTVLTVQPINSNPNYSQTGTPTTADVRQSLTVVSTGIAVVEELALDPNGLSARGVVASNSSLEYYYSRLPEIKASLLAEAAQDAKRRAEQIAENTGVRLGKPATMRAGVFQIKEPYSAEVSDYGMFDTRTKKKEISVTVHAGFRIE